MIVAASTAYETRVGVIMIRSPFNSIPAGYCQLGCTIAVECAVFSAPVLLKHKRSESATRSEKDVWDISLRSEQFLATKSGLFLFQRVLSAPPCAKVLRGLCRRCRCI